MTPTVIEMTDLLLAVKQATVIQLNTLYTTQSSTPLVGWLDPVPPDRATTVAFALYEPAHAAYTTPPRPA